jgi:riboflavin synthase
MLTGIGTVTHFAPVGELWELRALAPKMLARYVERMLRPL